MKLHRYAIRPSRLATLFLATGFILFSPNAKAQKARSFEPGTTPASLPATMDVTPSRGVGPFDAKQAREWRDAAEMLCAQSRYAEAEKLYAKLLEELEHSLGLNNPDLVPNLNDLGRVNFAQMKYQQAIAYYERSLQIMETSQGREDMAVIGPLEKLTRVYRALEKYDRAEQYTRRAMAVVEKAKGPDAVELAPELIALGDLLSLEKQFAPAQQEYDRAVKIYERTRGIASPDMLTGLDGLAASYAELHRPADAESAYRRALSIRESAYGPSTIEVADTLDRLGHFYFDQKKYPEAAYCYERTLFIRAKIHGDASPDTQATLTEVANVYGAQGRQADAEPLFRSMLSAKETDLVTSVNSLATLLAGHDRNNEAESLYKLSISVLDKHGFVTARKPVINPADPPPPLLAETLDQYAVLLKKMRKKSDAAKMEARARMIHGVPEKASSTYPKHGQ
jgi:tetratricopeptide (TPR) repeat protein